MNKKLKISLLICAGVFIAVNFLWLVGTFQSLDNVWGDFKFILRGQLPSDNNIVIVAIDEKSIAQMGRWPWPRRQHARLIEKLIKTYSARVVVFDVLFTEPDLTDIASDNELKLAVRRHKNVVLGGLFQYKEGAPDKYLTPFGFAPQSRHVGFVNIFPELDGKCRRVAVSIEYNGKLCPSLAMAALAAYYGKNYDEVISERSVILDADGELVVNYRGGYERFEYVSVVDVLNGSVTKDKFKDKIVIVGGTAAGLFDFKAIPYSPVFPGVEIHANTISNVMNGNFLRSVSWFYAWLLCLIFVLLLGYFLAKLSAWQGSVLAAGVIFFYLAFSYVLFLNNYSFNSVAPVVAALLCYIGVVIYRFFTEEKEKKYIKKTFSHYLSPHVLDEILNNPERLKLGGEKQNLTVLFSDIRGFTTMSEKMKPEEIVAILNEYLTEMVKVVFKYDGTLDKFIGDAVMAFWGAPIPQNDHALRGVLCARDMILELRRLRQKWQEMGAQYTINIGIGVNTGDMVVGNMGSQERMDYTVIGDNVNLGARLESLNKEYGTEIIISEYTYNVIKGTTDSLPFETKYLGEVKVKGKAKPVKVYQVIV